MEYTLNVIYKSQIVVIVILSISFILETTTGLKLFFEAFLRKKNYKMAQAAANLDSIVYFLICLGTLLYDRYISLNIPKDFSLWIWILLVGILTIIFNRLYFRFTPKDPDRGDFDMSD